MIDRRTFLAAVGIQQEHTQASPMALPATIEPSPAVDPSHLFIGRLMAYDSQREAVVSNNFELWTTANGCAFVMGDGQGEERRQIVFDQPDVVWAFTCMTRLMQAQGNYQDGVNS